MDAIGKIFSSLGGAIKGGLTTPTGGFDWGKLAQLGLGTAGTIGNIMSSRARNKELEAEQAIRNRYANLTPEQVATGIAGLKRPLSAGLIKGVGNVVQANMAERGLAQSPAIFSEVMAQALAPYEQSSQDRALQAYFQMLGLPIQAAPNPNLFSQPQSMSSIWRSILSGGRSLPTDPSASSPAPSPAPSPPYHGGIPEEGGSSDGGGHGLANFNWWDWLAPQWGGGG